MVIEKWETESALAHHLGAPHMHEYRKCVKSLVTGTVHSRARLGLTLL